MTQWNFPQLSIEGDRKYSDEDFAKFYELQYKNGVFITVADGLQVKASPTGGMRVVVSSGAANINGRSYINSEDLAIQISTASSSQDRIDSIVLRLDLDARNILLAYKQGSTTLERTDRVYELQLATIFVGRNVVNILGEAITDKRADDTVCGYASPFEKVQLSGLEQQYQSMLQQIFDEFVAKADNNQLDLEQLLTDQQAMFQNWLSGLQDELDSNQAGNLQNQINKLTADNEVIEIEHNLGKYPDVQVLYWEYGLGTVPLEEQPEGVSWDGTAPETIPVKVVHPSRKRMQIQVPIDYAMTNPVIKEVDGDFYLHEGIKSMRIEIGGK